MREDLIETELYKEHNYPNGIILAKKDSYPDVRQQQMKILRDLSNFMDAPRFNQYSYNENVKKLGRLEGHNEKVLEEVKIWANKIKEMQEEINKL